MWSRNITLFHLRSEIAAVAIFFTMLAQSVSACDCGWGGPFLNVAQESEVIVIGEVRSYQVNSLSLEIIEVLRGTENRSTIRLWGDNGAQCRSYVEEFPVGSRWIFALYSVTPSNGNGSMEDHDNAPPNEKKTDYEIFNCGEYVLRVVEDTAKGIISGLSYNSPEEKQTLTNIRNAISKWL